MDCKDCVHYEACADCYDSNTLDFIHGSCINFDEKSEYIRLPCKVGDYLYTHHTKQGWYMKKQHAPYRVKVVFIGLNNSDDMGGGYFNVVYEHGEMWQFYFSDIGKTVFQTREEVEKILEDERNESELPTA